MEHEEPTASPVSGQARSLVASLSAGGFVCLDGKWFLHFAKERLPKQLNSVCLQRVVHLTSSRERNVLVICDCKLPYERVEYVNRCVETVLQQAASPGKIRRLLLACGVQIHTHTPTESLVLDECGHGPELASLIAQQR